MIGNKDRPPVRILMILMAFAFSFEAMGYAMEEATSKTSLRKPMMGNRNVTDENSDYDSRARIVLNSLRANSVQLTPARRFPPAIRRSYKMQKEIEATFGLERGTYYIGKARKTIERASGLARRNYANYKIAKEIILQIFSASGIDLKRLNDVPLKARLIIMASKFKIDEYGAVKTEEELIRRIKPILFEIERKMTLRLRGSRTKRSSI